MRKYNTKEQNQKDGLFNVKNVLRILNIYQQGYRGKTQS